MRQRAFVEILSMLEVWRAWKRRLLIAFQTSQVLNISTYGQLKHELILLFYNIIKGMSDNSCPRQFASNN